MDCKNSIKMENKNSTKLVLSSLLVLTVLASFISATGVTSLYWNGENARPLYLQPGESKDIYFELQNMVGTSDVSFKVQVINGSEFVKLLDSKDIYEVPTQTENIKVNIKVTMPQTAKVGEKHIIGLAFTAVNPSAGGFSLGSAFDKYFDIIVPVDNNSITEEEDSSNNMYLYLLIGILILGIIIWFVKKNRSQ